jgi:polycomb group RING finger protein 4
MDLSPTVLLGLQVAGSIPDKPFSILVDHAVGTVIGNGDLTSLHENASLTKENQMQMKESYSSLMTMLIEAAKNDVGGSEIVHVLEECKFAPDRIDILKAKYMAKKDQMRASLRRVGSSFPHVVDVDWRLDYYIKVPNETYCVLCA